MSEPAFQLTPAYRVVPGCFVRHARQLYRLWSDSLEGVTGTHGKWKVEQMYLNNPAGPGMLFLLHHSESDAIVGVQCLVARRFQAPEGEAVAGIMADLAIDPAHRSLGPALKLLEAMVREGTGRLAFLYGFPNPRALPVMRRAGYQPVGNMTRYARPLRARQALSELLPRWGLGPVSTVVDQTLRWRDAMIDQINAYGFIGSAHDAIDDSFDTLWNSFNNTQAHIANRSAADLRWRYKAGGSTEWQLFTLRRMNHGTLLGYLIWTRHDSTARIIDFLALDNKRYLPALLNAFACHARQAGCHSVSVEFCGSQNVSDAIQFAHFKRREDEPIFGIAADPDALPKNWYLTGIDRDS